MEVCRKNWMFFRVHYVAISLSDKSRSDIYSQSVVRLTKYSFITGIEENATILQKFLPHLWQKIQFDSRLITYFVEHYQESTHSLREGEITK